jgi:hypothetical protein
MMRRLLLLSVLALQFSCAPQRQKDIEKVDMLRTQAESALKAQMLMGWNNWVFGRNSNQDSLYRVNEGLFTLENIELVRSLENTEPDSIQRKRFRYFRRYLTTEFISKSIASLADSVSNIEARASVRFEGEDIPYRQVSTMMAREENQARRARLYSAVDPLLDSLNNVLRAIEETNLSLTKTLGYESYTSMVADLKEIDLMAFKDVCVRVLAETEETYLSLLKEQLQRSVKLSPDRFYRYDTPRLFRGEQFDPYFPADSMLPVMRRTFVGMNIDPFAMKNLSIDDKSYEQKNPRAVCFPVDVPADVRLSIKPIGGPDDYFALFHEIGHGLHYASVHVHAMEFKYLGEPTLTETFAFLSEFLLANQAWLRSNSTMPVVVLKEFVRYQAFRRLYYIRRYCGKFLYELRLHDNVPRPDLEYAGILSAATGYQQVPSDARRYLTDVDPLYYSAGYLRAWFLEAMLNETLTERFGVNWFENQSTGEFLTGLWAEGDQMNGDELARLLGHEEISPDALLQEVNAMMLFSTK